MYLNKINLVLLELIRSNYAKLLSGSTAQVCLIITQESRRRKKITDLSMKFINVSYE